jgi:hypothetical protein
VADDSPKPKYLDERGRIIAPGIERPGDMTPISVKLPDIAALRDLSPADLLEVSQRYGVVAPWRDLFAQNAAYVEQFSKLPPGTDAFWAEVNRITLPEESKRAALGLARASQRNYNQLLATNGDEAQLLVRVGEGDDAMCEGCQGLEGAEGTYAEHEAIGLPGSQECGQGCRCQLMPVDSPAEQRGAQEGEGMGLADWLLLGAAAAIVIDSILEDADSDYD